MNGSITATGLLHLSRLTGLSKDLSSQDFVAYICSQEEFHSILVREKARADRNGHGFSIVAIEISNLENIQTLTGRFQQLIRTADEIGWFDHNTLGVFSITPRPWEPGNLSTTQRKRMILFLYPNVRYTATQMNGVLSNRSNE